MGKMQDGKDAAAAAAQMGTHVAANAATAARKLEMAVRDREIAAVETVRWWIGALI